MSVDGAIAVAVRDALQDELGRILGVAERQTDLAEHIASRPERLLFTEREAAEMLAVHPDTLSAMRRDLKVVPRCPSRPVRYDRSDLEKAVEALAAG